MQLRSLHLDSGRSWRGGQRQVLLLARSLRDLGDEPLVVAPVHAPLVERAHEAGLATAAAPMRNDWDLRSGKRIRSLVKTWKPHFVHAHDARAHAIALLALAGTDTPLIVTRRVTFRPKSVRLKYGNRVTQFIAISDAVRQSMVDSGVEKNRIEVVHSGVPHPQIESPVDWRSKFGWSRDSVIVGVVGAMTAEKGIDLIEQVVLALPIEAVKRTKFVFLGGKETGLKKIGARPGSAGADAYHAGFVTGIYDAMAGLDMLWHPSLEEGLGTSLLDALALKVPPIAFSVGGIPEIIEHDQQGLLAKAGDIQQFAHFHELMLEDSHRKRLADAGPDRADRFSVANMTQKTVQVYERVVNP